MLEYKAEGRAINVKSLPSFLSLSHQLLAPVLLPDHTRSSGTPIPHRQSPRPFRPLPNDRPSRPTPLHHRSPPIVWNHPSPLPQNRHGRLPRWRPSSKPNLLPVNLLHYLPRNLRDSHPPRSLFPRRPILPFLLPCRRARFPPPRV